MNDRASSDHVSLGSYAVRRDTGLLGAVGLGSCVAVILYDPVSRVGGLAHVMLPTLSLSRVRDQPTRAADSGVPWLIKEMCGKGAVSDRLVATLVGGATMFADLQPGGSMHIGERNVHQCRLALRQAGVPIVATLVGGRLGRTVWFDVATGVATVRATGHEAVEVAVGAHVRPRA
jgi:chemotaxis protein CheD